MEQYINLPKDQWRMAVAAQRPQREDSWASVIGWMMCVIIFASTVLVFDEARTPVNANDNNQNMCELTDR